MLEDGKLFKAGIIGAICTIIAEIITQILISIGFGQFSIFELSSMVITLNRPALFIGMIVSSTVGGLSAIFLYYFLIKCGSGHIVTKSILLSIVLWIALEAFFTMFTENRFFKLRPISSYYVHLIGAIIFAITEGLLFYRFLFYRNTAHND